MRQLARPLMLLAALTACRPNSQTAAERSAAAARADSSAAGYDVAAVGTASTTSGPAQKPSPDSVSDSTRRTGSGLIAGPTPDSQVKPVAINPTVTGRNGGSQTVHQTPVDSSGRGRGSGSRSGSGEPTRLTPIDPALEATFLAFDSTKRTLTFQLSAGNELPDLVSFNGARRGGRTLTVPAGWRITIQFSNRDEELPHSAIVIAGFEPIPEQLPPPAFPQAQTVKVEEGLLEGDSDEITFIADRAGRYMIACGVLSHAQQGQWLVLEVSSTAKVPSYR